jgi:hypothetical protein
MFSFPRRTFYLWQQTRVFPHFNKITVILFRSALRLKGYIVWIFAELKRILRAKFRVIGIFAELKMLRRILNECFNFLLLSARILWEVLALDMGTINTIELVLH